MTAKQRNSRPISTRLSSLMRELLCPPMLPVFSPSVLSDGLTSGAASGATGWLLAMGLAAGSPCGATMTVAWCCVVGSLGASGVSALAPKVRAATRPVTANVVMPTALMAGRRDRRWEVAQSSSTGFFVRVFMVGLPRCCRAGADNRLFATAAGRNYGDAGFMSRLSHDWAGGAPGGLAR